MNKKEIFIGVTIDGLLEAYSINGLKEKVVLFSISPAIGDIKIVEGHLLFNDSIRPKNDTVRRTISYKLINGFS